MTVAFEDAAWAMLDEDGVSEDVKVFLFIWATKKIKKASFALEPESL